jgi:hypothetical protein
MAHAISIAFVSDRIKSVSRRSGSPSVDRSAHSQMTAIRHPRTRSFSSDLASLPRFAAIFDVQKCVLVDGTVANRQPSWPCQKQPWTKTATL